MNTNELQRDSSAQERAWLLEKHGVCAFLSFPSARTEAGGGQRTPDAGACRFLLLLQGIFVLTEHSTTLSTFHWLSELWGEAGE